MTATPRSAAPGVTPSWASRRALPVWSGPAWVLRLDREQAPHHRHRVASRLPGEQLGGETRGDERHAREYARAGGRIGQGAVPRTCCNVTLHVAQWFVEMCSSERCTEASSMRCDHDNGMTTISCDTHNTSLPTVGVPCAGAFGD
jgi:hypothetical protein